MRCNGASSEPRDPFAIARDFTGEHRAGPEGKNGGRASRDGENAPHAICPYGLSELRGVLLLEHQWRVAEGLSVTLKPYAERSASRSRQQAVAAPAAFTVRAQRKTMGRVRRRSRSVEFARIEGTRAQGSIAPSSGHAENREVACGVDVHSLWRLAFHPERRKLSWWTAAQSAARLLLDSRLAD